MNNEWTIGTILDWTADYFGNAKISEARLDAEILLASVFNCPRLELLANGDKTVPQEKLKIYKKMISERQKRVPVAYILGEQEFMGLRFRITRHTLIPRQETELLVEEAVRIIKENKFETILELGAGSGNISVSIGKLTAAARIYAADISVDALRICQENIDIHGQSAKILLMKGDLFNAVENESLEQKIDMILSNPPYILSDEFSFLEPEIGYEPKIALDGGEDGLCFYRKIAEKSGIYLKQGGYLLMEINSKLRADISSILERNKFYVSGIVKDYSGLDRVISAIKM